MSQELLYDNVQMSQVHIASTPGINTLMILKYTLSCVAVIFQHASWC